LWKYVTNEAEGMELVATEREN